MRYYIAIMSWSDKTIHQVIGVFEDSFTAQENQDHIGLGLSEDYYSEVMSEDELIQKFNEDRTIH